MKKILKSLTYYSNVYSGINGVRNTIADDRQDDEFIDDTNGGRQCRHIRETRNQEH